MAPTARPWLKMVAAASSARLGGTRTTPPEDVTRCVAYGGWWYRLQQLHTFNVTMPVAQGGPDLHACMSWRVKLTGCCYCLTVCWTAVPILPQCWPIAYCIDYSQDDCSCSTCKDRFSRAGDGSSCTVRRGCSLHGWNQLPPAVQGSNAALF